MERASSSYTSAIICLRTESATNDVTDYGVKKAVGEPARTPLRSRRHLRQHLTVQQDILETFVMDALRKLTQPTVLRCGKRIRVCGIGFMHALVRFAHIAAGSSLITAIFKRSLWL